MLFMKAVIKTGGKQYLVSEGDVIRIEKVSGDKGSDIVFDEVLAIISEDKSSFGQCCVKGAKVKGVIMFQGRGKKLRIFKYKPKTGYRRRIGHRQCYTSVKITEIKK